jgi:hypothetical protein
MNDNERKNNILNKVEERLQKLSYFGDYFMRLYDNNIDEGMIHIKLVKELIDEGYLTSDIQELISLNKEGKALQRNGGYLVKVAEDNRQKELKLKQEETIEYNHKLAKMNYENYVPDKWKFWIPLGISLLAFLISTYGTYFKNNEKIIVINKAEKKHKAVIDTLAFANGEYVVDSTSK